MKILPTKLFSLCAISITMEQICENHPPNYYFLYVSLIIMTNNIHNLTLLQLPPLRAQVDTCPFIPTMVTNSEVTSSQYGDLVSHQVLTSSASSTRRRGLPFTRVRVWSTALHHAYLERGLLHFVC